MMVLRVVNSQKHTWTFSLGWIEWNICSTLGVEDTCCWILSFKQLPEELPHTSLWPPGLHLGTTRPSAALSQLPEITSHYPPPGLAGIAGASRKLHQGKRLWLFCEWQLSCDARKWQHKKKGFSQHVCVSTLWLQIGRTEFLPLGGC